MTEGAAAKTANRSVVGSMREFLFLAGVRRAHDADDELVEMSLELGRTPCGPLYRRHVSPDRELAAFVAAQQA